MTEEQNQIMHLQQKLADLQKRQELFQAEIISIKKEIEYLNRKPEPVAKTIQPNAQTQPATGTPVSEKTTAADTGAEKTTSAQKSSAQSVRKVDITDSKFKSDLERFIGEDLINKIGIVVTVIGVGIGAKYAIDHQLISPLTRIILGYLVGFGLLFFALRLRKKYENFSAVLLSGSMAIMYFITYAAYSFYSIYSQQVTFILMVIFTILTVTAALSYNREIIAIVGMVGAFAVPFMLSEGSENAVIFFSYVSIINSGILIIAVKKYWKPLYFSAFLFTWLIYFTWFFNSYKPGSDFDKALIFLSVFFVIFYLTFLSYKLIKKEKFNFFDILLLLLNSFIFYGAGYAILEGIPEGKNLAGLFTLGNAMIHFIVCLVIYRNKLADRNLFYLVSGLVIVFLTIAIPVQLNGNRVTLLWICEATILMSIGRIKSAPVYENIAYVLLIMSVLSLVEDWSKLQLNVSNSEALVQFTPVINIQFLSSLIFISAYAVMMEVYFNKKYRSPHVDKYETQKLLNYSLSVLFIGVIYLTVSNEISAYYNHARAVLIAESGSNLQSSPPSLLNISNFKSIWLCNYTLFFLAVLSLVNILKIKHRFFGIAVFWLSFLTLIVFLSQSLYILSELRESYIARLPSDILKVSGFNLIIRYVSFVFVALSLVATKLWIRKEPVDEYYRIFFSLMFHLTALWILCSEMLNILDLMQNVHSYKFGLSILCGIYALMLIVLGITGKKKYLRITAMVLLGITLVKLFFYDITKLDTIHKTILFLALGILLLIVSFLYNKYKVYLFGEHIGDSSSTFS